MALEKAIQLNPRLAAPHFFLGVVASRRQQYGKAIRRLETSAKLDPSNLVVSFYLGEAYFATRRYSDAATAFEKATSLADFRADVRYHLSKAYGELSKRALDRLDREHPGSFHMQLARGHFHEGRRDWKEAEKAYRAALKKNPGAAGLDARLKWVSRKGASDGSAGSPPPLAEGEASMLGLHYAPPSEGEIDSLIQEYRNRLGGSASAGRGEAKLYRQAQDYQIASYLAARWIGNNDPGSYRAHQLRAQLHESRGETDDAVREYRAPCGSSRIYRTYISPSAAFFGLCPDSMKPCPSWKPSCASTPIIPKPTTKSRTFSKCAVRTARRRSTCWNLFAKNRTWSKRAWQSSESISRRASSKKRSNR